MKDIPGFPGYQATASGLIWSNRSQKILFSRIGNHGYRSLKLRRGGKTITLLVHRLVALAYIPNPLGKRTVNHKNGVKVDNRSRNLEWATHQENHLHSFRKLGRRSGRLKNYWEVKL